MGELILPPSELLKPKVARDLRWSGVRAAHLAEFYWCAACGAKDSLNVHHRVPVHVDPALELDPKNLITLCEGDTLNCHLWCGHLGHWRSWNVNVFSDAAKFLRRVRTRPWK